MDINYGRKIPREIDNFFDNIMIDLASYLSGFFKKINFNPNHLTTIGNIFGIFCINYLLSKNYKYSAFCYFARYLFDCLDGFYSRKYNMETEFGDNYDHYSDYIFFIITTYILFQKVNFKNNQYFKIIYLLLSLTASIQLGCTEHFFKTKDKTNTHLSNLINICPKKNFINIIKYFGSGSFILFVIISLLYYIK